MRECDCAASSFCNHIIMKDKCCDIKSHHYKTRQVTGKYFTSSFLIALFVCYNNVIMNLIHLK